MKRLLYHEKPHKQVLEKPDIIYELNLRRNFTAIMKEDIGT